MHANAFVIQGGTEGKDYIKTGSEAAARLEKSGFDFKRINTIRQKGVDFFHEHKETRKQKIFRR